MSPIELNRTYKKAIVDAIQDDGFYILDNALSPPHYQALRLHVETLHLQGQFRHAKVGQRHTTQLNTHIRRDQIYWLDNTSEHEALNAYFATVNQISQTLNRSLFLGLCDYEAHFAIYEPGAFYSKHTDQFLTSQTRRISCVYYLNDQWSSQQGGQLMLYNVDHEVLAQVDPLGNRLVCFESQLPHEVTLTQHIRYSIVGWLKTR